MQSELIKHFEANKKGKDFIVGDIHGHYDELIEQLERINFNFGADRLFSVGDLVDRGQQNIEVLQLLDENWFFAVRGNHEQMIIDRYENALNKPAWSNTVKTREDAVKAHAANGGKWFDELETEQSRIYVYETIQDLPYIITFNLGTQTVGIVHAEVPGEFNNWLDFLSAFEANKAVRYKSLYGRNEITGYYDYVSDEHLDNENRLKLRHINGIGFVVHGHTSTKNQVCGGNQFWIDTFFKSGVFTIIEASELLSSNYK